MKRWLKILAAVASVALLALGALLIMVTRSMAPTTGEPIPAYGHPTKALLVVDIQEDYTGRNAKKSFREGDRILEASNRLLAQAEAQNLPVVYIQNVIENAAIRKLAGGVNAPGALGTAMDHRLKPLANAPTFQKSQSDAFSNPKLDAFLRQNQVDEVVIVGLDAAYCINATALGALNRGYRVKLITDGIATESGKNMTTLAETWRKAGATVQATPNL